MLPPRSPHFSAVPTGSKVNIPHIQVGDSKIKPVSVVRNIGAQLDETLGMRSHVNSLQGALLLAQHQQDTTPAGQEDNSNACSCLCNIAAGQWECIALWTPSNSAIQGATSLECSCSHCVSDWPTGAHNSSTERTTLAACPSADFIQGAQCWPIKHCMGLHLSTWPIYFPGTSQQDHYAPVTHCCSLPHKVA